MEYIRHFDLFISFGYIERVVKSDFFPEKYYFTLYVRTMFWARILYKYHGTRERWGRNEDKYDAPKKQY